MTGIEITIITAIVFILFALERVYSQSKATNRCLGKIEGLLTQIKDDAQHHYQDNSIGDDLSDIKDVLNNIDSSSAFAIEYLDKIIMALHGDYKDPVEQRLNPIKQIEESLEGHQEKLREIRNALFDINLALEPARLRAERRFIRNMIEFSNMVDGASCGQPPPEQRTSLCGFSWG